MVNVTYIVEPARLNLGIVAFYDMLATELYGKTFDHYDCRKVEVGKEVLDRIEEYYLEQGMDRVQFGMMWVCYGPKATLPGYQVKVEADWATDDESEV